MNYDIIVVGAGHAGCEASLACARKGHKTLLITGNINNIADNAITSNPIDYSEVETDTTTSVTSPTTSVVDNSYNTSNIRPYM